MKSLANADFLKIETCPLGQFHSTHFFMRLRHMCAYYYAIMKLKIQSQKIHTGGRKNNTMKKQAYARVLLTQLIPFSGKMYNEDGTEATNISGNPFYVPEDYLDKNKTDAESISLRQLHASIEHDGVRTPLLVRPAKKAGEATSVESNESDNTVGTVDASASVETVDNNGSVANEEIAADSGQKDDNVEDTADAAEELEKYELLSGYRRKRVCEKLSEMKKTKTKFQRVPVIIIDCDDDEASTIMTTSNVQRNKANLLEKILSCGRMYRAMRHRGKDKKTKETTADIVSKITGLKMRTVFRYSQLLDLPEAMLQLVGNKVKTEAGDLRLSIHAGEVLSGLTKDQLEVINQVLLSSDDKTVSIQQANKLKKFCAVEDEEAQNDTDEVNEENNNNNEVHKILTVEDVERILSEPDETAKADETVKVRKRRLAFDDERLNTYCRDMTDQEIEELFYELLEKWSAAGEQGTGQSATQA